MLPYKAFYINSGLSHGQGHEPSGLILIKDVIKYGDLSHNCLRSLRFYMARGLERHKYKALAKEHDIYSLIEAYPRLLM